MADKYIRNNAGMMTETEALVTSAGAGSAGRIIALDAGGKLDNTLLPSGIGADAKSMTTSEAISAGDFVNIWNSSGPKVRKADASTSGKEAHGYVTASAASGAAVTVYFEGANGSVTGQTPGVVFLSAATPGAATATAPSGSGQVVQRIGFATGTTEVNFQSQPPIVLA